MTADPSDLAAFYEASYERLVMVVGAVTGSSPLAEDAVQEAFVRLIPAWSKVVAYDEPEAWVRKVALGFASNRRRKIRNGFRAISRLSVQTDSPPPSADRVDVSRALMQLPQSLRAVSVLHYYCDLPVSQIAAELNVPVGTVKSRLSRARAALATTLEERESHA